MNQGRVIEAKEAYRQTDLNLMKSEAAREKQANSDVYRLMDAIRGYIEIGKFEMHVRELLSERVIKKIKSLGYEVTLTDRQGDFGYIISWENK